jgi:hypothetical protein
MEKEKENCCVDCGVEESELETEKERIMKTIYLTNKDDDNIAEFFATVDGDIVDTEADAEITGLAARLITHGFFVGSVEEWREHVRKQYIDYCE